MKPSKYDWQAQREYVETSPEQARWEFAALMVREGNLKPLADLIRIGAELPNNETREHIAVFLGQHCAAPRSMMPLYSAEEKQQISTVIELDRQVRNEPQRKDELINEAVDRSGLSRNSIESLFGKTGRLWQKVRVHFRKDTPR